MKEFGEKCVEFSVAEHLAKVRGDMQAAPVELIGRQPDTSALASTELEWEDALHTRSRQAARDTAERWVLCVLRCPERELRFFGKVATCRPSSQTRTTHAEQYERSVVV